MNDNIKTIIGIIIIASIILFGVHSCDKRYENLPKTKFINKAFDECYFDPENKIRHELRNYCWNYSRREWGQIK